MIEAMPTRLTPPQCPQGCQQSYIDFLALPPLLFALQAANSNKTPHHRPPTSNMLKSHKNHRRPAVIPAHSKFPTLQIYKSSKHLKPCPPD